MSELLENQYKDSTSYRARIELHRRFSSNRYPWPVWIFDNIEKEENLRVLELGCGNGLLWRANAGRIPASWNITLSDFSEGMLNDAAEFIGDSVQGISFRVVDASEIPFENETFDLIMANHMIYHLPDRRRAFEEIRRVLKKNGKFYATTMRGGYMKELYQIIREYKTGSSSGLNSGGVIGNFSIENGGEQLSEFFNIVDLKIYENSLSVDDASLLADYAFSLNGISGERKILHESERGGFTEFLRDRISSDGNLVITSDAGLFICVI